MDKIYIIVSGNSEDYGGVVGYCKTERKAKQICYEHNMEEYLYRSWHVEEANEMKYNEWD